MFLKRKCNSNYTFNGTKVSIPAGTSVIIPLYAIQTDPKFYENPDVFDPERFNEDAVAARHPMTYLPFGDGPRNCIGKEKYQNILCVCDYDIMNNYQSYLDLK